MCEGLMINYVTEFYRIKRKLQVHRAGSQHVCKFYESRKRSNAERPDQPVESGRYTSLRSRFPFTLPAFKQTYTSTDDESAVLYRCSQTRSPTSLVLYPILPAA